MIRLIQYLFGFYFLVGILVLPNGNFVLVSQLPEMYAHCKANEDKDMTVSDFVTDHLICIDAMFDAHDHGDEQKPHKPVKADFEIQPTFFQHFHSIVLAPAIQNLAICLNAPSTGRYDFHWQNNVLRPPILRLC